MRTIARSVLWYLRELTGETQYDRYLERHAREHAGTAPLSRREFERRRIHRAGAPSSARSYRAFSSSVTSVTLFFASPKSIEVLSA
jgi:uncharacterized short protein YbdD (DUF466 family)